MESLDIVQLIENNPIVKLSSGYEGKLVNKIKETFTDTQQKLFVSSFYCYLNYDPNKDFVIKLNDVWKWIGYSRISFAKTFLTKNFVKDVDYRVEVLIADAEIKKGRGGDRKSELITMTINTFNKFCMKSRTSKADEIHDYYFKLEDVIYGTVNEESEDLRMKLKNKCEESEDLKTDVEAIEKDKNIIINSLKLELQVRKNELEELKIENNELKNINKDLKNLEKEAIGTKVVDIQLNSMDNLVRKRMEIQNAVCINFLVNFVANEIKLNDNKTDIVVNISTDEFFEKYKKFRLSNKYTEPIFDKKYEKSLLTKSINSVVGIMRSSYSSGDRNIILHIHTIVDWIVENVLVPKHFRTLFREATIGCDYYQHKSLTDMEMGAELKHIYDFLVCLVLKNICYMDKTSKGNSILRRNPDNITKLFIKSSIVNEEYLKFYLNDFYHRRLKMSRIYDIIDKVPGIKQVRKNKICMLYIEIVDTCKWIKSKLHLGDKTKELL